LSTGIEEDLQAIEAATKPETPIPMAPEPDWLELPVGLQTPAGVVTRVQVRELNGFDEEAVARSKTIGAALLTILERATVRIGDEPSSPALLRELFLGDRLAILVGISRCTWGANVVIDLACPFCSENNEIDYDLNDLSVVLGSPREGYFDIRLKSGKLASCHWPKGDVQEALAHADMDNQAEFRTVLINRCVDELDGIPLLGDAARTLSVRDRKELVEAIQKNVVGPRFDLTTANCPSCGKEVSAVLTVGDLFPL
jgi:endogenous inhibitor of DNA gyrase (YacG/DUF329 family)